MEIIFIRSEDVFSLKLEKNLIKVREMLANGVSIFSVSGQKDACLASEIDNFLTTYWITSTIDNRDDFSFKKDGSNCDYDCLADSLREIWLQDSNCLIIIIDPALIELIISSVCKKSDSSPENMDKYPKEMDFGDILVIRGDEIRHFSV